MPDLMFPKPTKKKKRKTIKHKKIVMQRKEDGMCYICANIYHDYRYKRDREQHHVMFGGGKRELSKEWGCEVYLCQEHHRYGPDAVHNNEKMRNYLCVKAQTQFEKELPEYDWMEIFGRNYL